MSFKELFLASVGYVYLYQTQLFKALLLPFSLFLILDVTEYYSANDQLSIFSFLISMMLQTLFAVTTHRVLLMGSNSVPQWGYQKWSSRDTTFTLYVLLLLLAYLPAIAFIQVPPLAFAQVVTITVFVIPRFSLVFPAIAIGESYSIKNSWVVTKNYKVLMFYAVVGIPFVLSIPIMLLNLIPYTALLTIILNNMIIVITVAALSVAYKYIVSDLARGE